MNKNEILKELENESTKARSAWKKGVALYAIDLLDDLKNRKITKENLLNGAKNFKDYSYSGLSLIYDEDICKRLCNNTEKKLTKNGEKMPNKNENWLDVQARALYQAYLKVIDLYNANSKILELLNNKMKKECSKKENKYKHITFIRKKVLEEAKANNLIKDYKNVQNTKNGNLYFGSLAGFDKMYQIIL